MHVKKIKKNLKTIYKLQNSKRKIRKEKRSLNQIEGRKVRVKKAE